MSEPKVVHFNLFRPENAFFKQKANTRAKIQYITCSNVDQCRLLSRGECACRYGMFGGSKCPYGSFHRVTGPTRRARSYSAWCQKQKETYPGIPFLRDPKVLGVVGDYVFLPYPHMKDCQEVSWKNTYFISLEEFTPDVVIRLARFRPRSFFGEEISSYQKTTVSLFLKHLSEQMPELFQAVITQGASCLEQYRKFSNIGREAILQTLNPGIGKFADIHGGSWLWDGTYLTSGNSHMSFGLCKFSEVRITPLPDQKVKVTDEGQVNTNTVFTE